MTTSGRIRNKISTHKTQKSPPILTFTATLLVYIIGCEIEATSTDGSDKAVYELSSLYRELGGRTGTSAIIQDQQLSICFILISVTLLLRTALQRKLLSTKMLYITQKNSVFVLFMEWLTLQKAK